MRRAARATGPKRCLRAVRLEPRDQFHQFHRRHRIPGEYQQRRAAQKRDWFEITEQVVLQRVDGAVHDMCTPVAAAECITVWRSTPDRAIARLPEAPVMFSTMTDCPSVALMCWAKIRTLVSVGPPAAYPMTIVIGRAG